MVASRGGGVAVPRYDRTPARRRLSTHCIPRPEDEEGISKGVYAEPSDQEVRKKLCRILSPAVGGEQESGHTHRQHPDRSKTKAVLSRRPFRNSPSGGKIIVAM